MDGLIQISCLLYCIVLISDIARLLARSQILGKGPGRTQARLSEKGQEHRSFYNIFLVTRKMLK